MEYSFNFWYLSNDIDIIRKLYNVYKVNIHNDCIPLDYRTRKNEKVGNIAELMVTTFSYGEKFLNQLRICMI